MKLQDLFEARERALGGVLVKGQNVLLNGKRRPIWAGDLVCRNNQLTSLEGAPVHVTGYFSCSSNRLTSLEGGPEVVDSDFFCDNNQLTSIEGAPRKVKGVFSCTINPDLKSISGVHLLFDRLVEFNCDDVTHVLGLCLIPGIKMVLHKNDEVQEILNRHLGNGRAGLCDAQDELLDAGLDKYALL